tara:strand:+ start:185 stop:394 length:210 start_codon:yes stop_codon:yes gene_type:complete
MKHERAFPQPEPIFNEFHQNYGKDRGMTLRDYFAARAMQGMITRRIFNDEDDAILAYKMADEMMRAREA